jgi:anti-anti-sigma factor
MDVEDAENGITRIRLAGDLDITGAGEIDLRFAAVTGGRTKVVVDMGEVRFLASIGIRCLMSGAKAVNRRGGRMVLLDPPEAVAEVLRVCGADSVIPVIQGWDQAVSAVSAV